MPVVVAHLAGRNGLTIPVWVVAWLSVMVIIVLAFWLRSSWLKPRFTHTTAAAAAPAVTRVPAALFVARAIGLAAFVFVFGAAAFGPSDPGANVAPFAVCTVFSVGMPALCAIAGDAFRLVNPFATLAALIRLPRHTGRHAPPRHWTAAVLLFSFVWLEYAFYARCAEPRVLAWWLTGYTIAVLAGAAVWGTEWIPDGEAFGALLGLIGALGVVGRDDEGRLHLRAPLSALPKLPTATGTIALLSVSIGSTLFGVTLSSRIWSHVGGTRGPLGFTLVNTLGMLWEILVVAACFIGTMRYAATRMDRDPDSVVAAATRSMLPVALGLIVAAGFLAFVVDYQNVIVLASDPLGRGWDLFGTIGNNINYRQVPISVIAWVQAVTLTGGPALGLVIAHDAVLRLAPARLAIRALLPLSVLFIAAAAGGMGLVLGV